MKSLFDIYEDGCINSTPSNTIGMGNPMPPTAEAPGSEPLVGKCKTQRKKKHKVCEEPAVKEGLLSGMEDTLQAGDAVIEFVEWFINQHFEEYDFDVETAKQIMYSAVSMKGKSTVVIDIEKTLGKYIPKFMPDRLLIKTVNVPKKFKKIKVINCSFSYAIISYDADVSNFDIEVYADNGKTYGNLEAAFKFASGTVFKFGNIKCSNFRVASPKVKTLELGKHNDMLTVDLEQCYELERIKGDFGMPEEIKLSKKFIKALLIEKGLASTGTNVKLYN